MGEISPRLCSCTPACRTRFPTIVFSLAPKSANLYPCPFRHEVGHLFPAMAMAGLRAGLGCGGAFRLGILSLIPAAEPSGWRPGYAPGCASCLPPVNGCGLCDPRRAKNIPAAAFGQTGLAAGPYADEQTSGGGDGEAKPLRAGPVCLFRKLGVVFLSLSESDVGQEARASCHVVDADRISSVHS